MDRDASIATGSTLNFPAEKQHILDISSFRAAHFYHDYYDDYFSHG